MSLFHMCMGAFESRWDDSDGVQGDPKHSFGDECEMKKGGRGDLEQSCLSS